MYSAYVLTEPSRTRLMKYIKPKYERIIGHHVTREFGIPKDSIAPDDAVVRCYGYIDSGDGLEVILVAINNELQRPDGKHYHITWSLDPSKYSPKDSNQLINETDGYEKITNHYLNNSPMILK